MPVCDVVATESSAGISMLFFSGALKVQRSEAQKATILVCRISELGTISGVSSDLLALTLFLWFLEVPLNKINTTRPV